jgi:cyclophilin family peptidyl-prolyl cis-trans isomerase
MSTRKLINERRALETQRTRKMQFIALGILAVIAIAVIWAATTKKAAAPTSAASAAATAAPAGQVSNAPTPKSLQFNAVPPMNIDATKQYFADFKMAKGGDFVIQLFPDKAPITVNSFIFLARQGYFDGVTFHRVIDGFMAQGGDPTGTGMGGPGYEFEYEANDLKFDKPGVVAMANTGAGTPTNGSQFFITFGPTPNLDGGYTIFGQVISGMDVVNGITRRDPAQNPTFAGDAILSVTISEK